MTKDIPVTEVYEHYDLNNLTEKQVETIVFDECFQYKVVEEEIVDTSRWHNGMRVIFEDKETNKHYSICYGQAATEYQEHEFYDPEAKEVEQLKIMVTKWVEKK